MAILENLKKLKENMEQTNWMIDGFPFTYKHKNYFVIVRRFDNDYKKKNNQYALLEIEFLEKNNWSNNLIIEVNSQKFLTEPKILREYFEIEYSSNLGDILRQFAEHFAKFIPLQVNENRVRELEGILVRALSVSDSEDPEKIYCFCVSRNTKKGGTPGHRSPYNDNKARILRPNLYEKFKDNFEVSFCFAIEKERVKSDEEILENFLKNKGNR